MLIRKRLSILYKKSSKKDALKRTLSGCKRIMREKDAKKVQRCRILTTIQRLHNY